MFEVFREYHFGEECLIENNKTDAIGCPSYNIFILLILNERSGTLSRSNVFRRKDETPLAFFLACANSYWFLIIFLYSKWKINNFHQHNNRIKWKNLGETCKSINASILE